MEILNKDDEIERLVVATGFGITDLTGQTVVQRDSDRSLSVRMKDSDSSVGGKLWWREWPRKQPRFIISAVACRWFAILSKQTAGEKRACSQ